MIQKILADENVSSYIQSYETFRERCLKGDFGKTPQFWMMYMNLTDRQRKLHFAINTNDFSLRLLVWKESLPLCFATNRVHYSRYGTYYLKSLECLESTHPGAKEEIENVSLSVRRNTLGIGQAVDLAGEQTYMRNAKTAGGVTQFAVKESTVTKWVLNRPYQTRFAESLMEIAGLTTTSANPKKCLRPSEILKSNKMVDNIVCALETQFINPFHPNLEHDKLYNLVSGCPVPDSVSESLLQCEETGRKHMEQFEARMTDTVHATKFFDPIPKVAIKTFKDATVKSTVRSKGKSKELVFQRNILGLLVAHSNKHNMAIIL